MGKSGRRVGGFSFAKTDFEIVSDSLLLKKNTIVDCQRCGW